MTNLIMGKHRGLDAQSQEIKEEDGLTTSFDQSPPVTGCEVAMNGKTAEFAILHPPQTQHCTGLHCNLVQSV